MRASLGQTVVIENVTGAGSTLGVGRAAQAAPTATPSPSAIGRASSAPARSTGLVRPVAGFRAGPLLSVCADC